MPITFLRSAGRVDNWWYSKVAPALAVSYCAALVYRVPALAAAESFLWIAWIGLCAGTYGHVINDIFDIDVDWRAGKPNRMARFSSMQQLFFCVLAVGLGFVPALLMSFSRRSLLLLAVEYLLPTLYAAPPFRLKSRGVLALLCDTMGAHLVPCLFVISVLAHQAGSRGSLHAVSPGVFIALVSAWSFCLGLIGITVHEFEDRENDIRSGIHTFATELLFEQVRRPVSVVYLVELISFLALAVVLAPVAPALVAAAVVYLALVVTRIRAHWHHYRLHQHESTLIQWWQLSHPFYETYFPLAVAAACAWVHPSLIVFPLLQLVVFARAFRQHMPELRELRTHLVLRGRLDLSGSAVARARLILTPRPGARIEIERGGVERWDVRLARTGVAVRAGREYVMHLQVRADRPRAVLFGVWQDHAPWNGAGLCEELQVSTQWQHVRRSFVAADDNPFAYLGLWLGGDGSAIEVRRCSIRAAFRFSGAKA